MTGTPQEPQEQQPQSGYGAQPGRSAQPPLPGPADETERPMTIIPGPSAEDTLDWNRPAAPPARVHESQPAAYQSGGQVTPHSGEGATITGIFSSVTRDGRWEVPPVLTLVQGFAELRLDLREAVISSPVVELHVYGAFTDCKIVVPPGVGVEFVGGGSLFSDEKAVRVGPVDPTMWRLKVVHYGAFSDIKVKTLAVGEAEKKWWKKFG